MQCYAALGVQAYPCWGPRTPFPLFRWPRGPCSCRVLGLHHPSAVLPATPAPHRPPEPHLRPVPWQQRAPGPGSQRSPREGSRAQTGEGGAAGADKQTFCSPGCCQPGISPRLGWGPHTEWVLRAKWAGGRRASAVWTDPPARGLPPAAQSPHIGPGQLANKNLPLTDANYRALRFPS